ncbi:hypothetical protein NQ315_007472 [Exocentrus adspersus]|uniref:Methionine aminopeptidase n=1 Tax=Exocentrus adspersus TaxID=1586481 RepID=A0AAV8V6F4_9CUCU|nr:hypothetical protein NQ315_007472 [Exocentrus adspersus]
MLTKESMEEGIKFAGVDVRVCDIGEKISEVINSYEIQFEGNVAKIIPVENLNGHSIGKYCIHSGITIPLVKNDDTTKLIGNEFYALETFATTGNGFVRNGLNCSHYIYVDRLLNLDNFSKPHIEILTLYNMLEAYPPLMDIKGSYVAQFEHTLFLSENGGKEILTRGDDY